MFERYTERARRVLFFARYETSQLGSLSIGPEHLLLGIARETKGLTAQMFSKAGLSREAVRTHIGRGTDFEEKTAVSVEIPFAEAAKRLLSYAAEEADRLSHDRIGAPHLRCVYRAAKKYAQLENLPLGPHEEVAGSTREHDRLVRGVDPLIPEADGGLAQSLPRFHQVLRQILRERGSASSRV